MNKIRLLISENNRILRKCLVEIIKPQSDISIISTSGNDNSILQKIKLFNPNVILLEKRLAFFILFAFYNRLGFDD